MESESGDISEQLLGIALENRLFKTFLYTFTSIHLIIIVLLISILIINLKKS